MNDAIDKSWSAFMSAKEWADAMWARRTDYPDRECRVCGTIAPETTMEFEQGERWNRGTFRCYDTDACDRRASGLYVTGDYDDLERGDDE